MAEIAAAARSGFVHGVKLYPAGATTNSDAGVRSIDRVMPVLEAMAEHGLPLLVHGEVVDDEVDIFEREAVFIERTLAPLRQRLPTLNVVLEHITTEEAAHYVRDAMRPPTARVGWGRRSLPTTCATTAMPSSRTVCGRTGTACRC